MKDKDTKKIIKKLEEIEEKLDAIIIADEDAQDYLANEFEIEVTDDEFEEAVLYTAEQETITMYQIQRILGTGVVRACKIMEMMEEEGVIGPGGSFRPRDVIIEDPYDFLKKRTSN